MAEKETETTIPPGTITFIEQDDDTLILQYGNPNNIKRFELKAVQVWDVKPEEEDE